MNLIELFESKPFQDVGTFNAIFKTTPILDFPATAEVEIKGLVNGGLRKLIVNNTEVIMDLTQSKQVQEFSKEVKPLPAKETKKLFKKQKVLLPALYRRLSSSEFMIYHAVKELGEVYGITELSKHIALTRKTISQGLPRLKELGLIKTELTGVDTGGAFLKITIDTANNN